MTTIDIGEAATQLPQLIERAQAGEEIVIARSGQPAVQLLPRKVDPPESKARVGGQWEGKMWIAPDFEEWPDEIAQALGMRD